MADIYHIWCNPKEGVDAAEFANKIKIFLGNTQTKRVTVKFMIISSGKPMLK